MNIILLFYFTFIISSCSFYYDNICCSADPKIKFQQNIIDNPENMDSMIINSEYYYKDYNLIIKDIITKNDCESI